MKDMATGGWGTGAGWGAAGGGGGAWGSKAPNPVHDPDLDDSPRAQQPGVSPLYTAPQPTPAAGYSSAFQPSTSTKVAAPDDSYPASHLAAREAELDKRAAELAAKEKRLKALEEDLERSGVVIKKKNWPIFINFIYHSIADDIPQESRRVVREIYACWWGLCWCLGFNFFCASVILGTGADQRVASWFLAIIYAVLGAPLAFWMWYYRIYRAARDESKVGFMVFFIMFGIHIAFCIWASIAVPFSSEAWSFAGWVTAMVALGEGTFPGVVYIMGAVFWTCESIYCLWCCKDAYLFFRGKGGIEAAKQEAAKEAAVAAFRQGMQPSNARV